MPKTIPDRIEIAFCSNCDYLGHLCRDCIIPKTSDTVRSSVIGNSTHIGPFKTVAPAAWRILIKIILEIIPFAYN